MRRYLIIGSGGTLGALARYGLGNFFKIGVGGFPEGTFIINLTGSFILGLFLTLITEHFVIPTEWRLFFATGFVGAYTTFSSFTNEVLTLYRQGYVATGLLYSITSLVGGTLFVWLGLIVAHQIIFLRTNQTEQEAKQGWKET
ncbi:MAG: fluoride efflux transporter CrcB [Chloroflexota bacterium]|nr:fluoride efflux transporter CrcB [Chloroflexota bacterium]